MRALIATLFAWAMLCLAPAIALAQEPVPISNETCKTCHVPYEAHKVNVYHSDCLACHRPETRHLTEGGRGSVQLPTSEKCLSCHQYNDHRRMNWAFAEHNKAKVECRDCHGIHAPKIKQVNVGMWKSDRISALCVSCHKDVAARLTMPSHHPVIEGAMSCVSCHDPHNSKTATLVTKTEQCTKCHQNVRGPHVFEHPPAVEDCVICHNPHGSPNRRLLQLAQPMQCLQCHSLASRMHGNPPRGAQLRGCTNCHGAVHGSQSDPVLKY